MKISVEISPVDLKRIQKLTGERKKSLAIITALSAYLREQEKRALILRALKGQTDYQMTNDQLEAMESE